MTKVEGWTRLRYLDVLLVGALGRRCIESRHERVRRIGFGLLSNRFYYFG